MKTEVSSTNRYNKRLLVQLAISLMYIRKRRGPSLSLERMIHVNPRDISGSG